MTNNKINKENEIYVMTKQILLKDFSCFIEHLNPFPYCHRIPIIRVHHSHHRAWYILGTIEYIIINRISARRYCRRRIPVAAVCDVCLWIISSGLAAYLKNLERPEITFWNYKNLILSVVVAHIGTHARTE